MFARPVTASRTEARAGTTATPTSERSAAHRARGNDQEVETDLANPATAATRSGCSWGFGKIPLFPPDPAAHGPKTPAALPPSGAIQRKLAIGRSDDPLEHEADRVADRVMRMGLDGRRREPASRRISLGEAAANLKAEREVRQAGILAHGPRFRVPTTADMKALFASGRVPEEVFKKSVELALNRMAEEHRLKSNEPVTDIMKKIFHPGTSPMSMRGVFDEAAYEAVIDVTNREQVYQSVLDAEFKVPAGDKPKLKTIMQDSMKLIDDSIADEADIKLVFGTKHAFAKAVYGKAKAAIQKAIDHMDERITTDLNLDDPETGLGGWAMFVDADTGKPHVHFEASVVKVKDEVEAKITIIHESCHLADPSVGDEGKYYGSPGFEAEKDLAKATNAAHYEEVPMRILNLSRYKDATGNFVEFKPGTSSSGIPQTFPEKARTKADQVLRKAWDKAVDVF